jgi:hypothetical protein
MKQTYFKNTKENKKGIAGQARNDTVFHVKLYHKIAALFICASMIPACSVDEGPSVDDHFLNYEIEDIPLTADCPVGAFYYFYGSGVDQAAYGRLTEQPNEKASPARVGPYVLPVLGRYSNNSPSEATIEVIQQHIDWCIEGGIDFLILQECNEVGTKLYPNNLDTTVYYLATGKTGSDRKPAAVSEGTVVNWKSLKYAMSVSMNGINSGLAYNALLEDAAPTVIEGESRTRIDRFNDFFKRISDFFSDPNYYRVNGKPLVILANNAKNVYTADSRKLYDDMRAYVKEHCGEDIFLVARQDNWSPPARFEHFFVNGHVDAVTHLNMYDQGTYDRSYWYPQLIDQNWNYSKDFFMANWGIDYIPTISPSCNEYVNSGVYNRPIVYKSESGFKTHCNVAKKNLGQTRIVFVESFNYWQKDTAIEPTDPEYGNGYGMTYLNIIKERFKK